MEKRTCTTMYSPELKTLGERLKFIRNSLSQSQFAAKFNIPQTTLSRYERNSSEPDLKFLSQVSQQYNVSLEWLIAGRGTLHIEDEDIMLKYPFEDPFIAKEYILKEYSKIKDMLEHEQRERRELSTENRRLYREKEELYRDKEKLLKEKEGLLRENGMLKEKLVRLEIEQQKN